MQIIADRRALHKIPELELCLPKTMDYLKNALKGLKCRVFSPVSHSLCAYFDFGGSKTVAFRCDCDALPVVERSNHDYVSTHEGKMHACGHDGHMAILLELARRLNSTERLSNNVLLIFQAGEESPGGAKDICDSGVLTEYGVAAIFGLHIWPTLEKGKVFTRANELMSHASEVTVDIRGKSAHLAKSKDGIDAMSAAVELHGKVAEAEAAWPDSVYRLLKFGKLLSGTARNAVADFAHMEGSLRAFQDEVFDTLKARLYEIAAEMEAKYGVQVAIHMSQGYPAVMNPPELVEKLHEIAEFTELPEPTMTAEDFAWYQRFVPGVFFFLGLGDSPALHTDHFDFDEKVLLNGAEFFEELARKI
jgi:hippurate hydrolase